MTHRIRFAKVFRFCFYIFVIGVVRASLRTFGFRRTIQRAKKFAMRCAVQPPGPNAIDDATDLARLVESAAAIFPGRARCLEQSLCVYLLLRRRGVPAELRIGARALPFAAHAWVDVAGRCINTEADVLAAFQVFPEVGG